jgi:serine/threonine protein kinase
VLYSRIYLVDSESNPLKGHGVVTKTPKQFESAFESYAVARQIGCGGSGTVFEVRTPEGQTLALKLLNIVQTSKQKLKRFQNEIRFCQRPASPHIVQVIDYGRTADGSLFYVMPLYSGTVRDLIRKKLNPEEVLPHFGQILDGVEAAHLLGVYHRDLKPENLLHDAAGKRIVLGDFGIASFGEDELLTLVETGPHERLANFVYAAPEQRNAGKAVDHRADIYALGLILNEMFTGDIPQGTGFRLVKDVAPPFAYVDDLVSMMMQQQPENRTDSVARVKIELMARGNRFIELQRLDALKKEVVLDSEVQDPLISDPIRVIKVEDFRNRKLTVKLNRPINRNWEQCFRMRATAYRGTVSAAMMLFQGDVVSISVDDNFAPQALAALKQFCENTNELYAEETRKAHRKELDRARIQQAHRVAEEEARLKVLNKLQI